MVWEATAEDARAVAELHVRTRRAAYGGFLPPELLDGMSVDLRAGTWREILDGDGGFTLPSEDDGVLAGFCTMALPSRDDDAGDRVAEIAAVHVDPSRWLGGVGRELLEAALSRLPADDWDQLTLWTFKRNAQARAFFARFGLRPDGREKFHDSGQAVVRLRTVPPGENSTA